MIINSNLNSSTIDKLGYHSASYPTGITKRKSLAIQGWVVSHVGHTTPATPHQNPGRYHWSALSCVQLQLHLATYNKRGKWWKSSNGVLSEMFKWKATATATFLCKKSINLWPEIAQGLTSVLGINYVVIIIVWWKLAQILNSSDSYCYILIVSV